MDAQNMEVQNGEEEEMTTENEELNGTGIESQVKIEDKDD